MSVYAIVNTILNEREYDIVFVLKNAHVRITNGKIHFGGRFGENCLKMVTSLFWGYSNTYYRIRPKYISITNMVKQKSTLHRDALQKIVENLFDLGYNVVRMRS